MEEEEEETNVAQLVPPRLYLYLFLYSHVHKLAGGARLSFSILSVSRRVERKKMEQEEEV